MKNKIIYSLSIAFISMQSITAQIINPCGMNEAVELAKKNIPGYAERSETNNKKLDAEFQQHLAKMGTQKTSSVTPTFTIPVVFHILHTNGVENISDNLCINALAQVNRDYAREGSDTGTIDPVYKSRYVNSNMVFQLAKKDPQGNCTNGIVHHYDTDTDWDQNKYFAAKYSWNGPSYWMSSRYLNIYVVKQIIGPSQGIIVGYTYKPGTVPYDCNDAIVYRYDFLSGLNARSLSHEMGHWFGLSHTFGDGNNAGISCGNDDIYDTPKTSGFFSTCPPNSMLSDSCDPGKKPNLENIMDYSACPKMFTQGQTDKIRFTANSTIQHRDSLSSLINLIRTGLINNTVTACAPIADFYANKLNTCNGQSVIYNSTSYNSPITGYNWSFEGGNPATSTSPNPTIQYSIPGIYSTTLIVTGSQGTSTAVRTNFVNNHWNTDVTVPSSQNFENGLNENWNVQNLDYLSPTWQQANVGSQSSSKSFYLPNTYNGSNKPRHIDILESPQYNFHNTTNISISYDYAYALCPNAKNFTFKFQYSIDCGGSWSDLSTTPSSTAMAIASAGSNPIPYNMPFVPWAAKWVNKTYATTATATLNNKSDVKFRFWYQNAEGMGQTQDLYIDQFNISGVVSIHDLENDIKLLLYPNPSYGSASIEFIMNNDTKGEISVFDIIGKKVEQDDFKVLSGEAHHYTINKSQQLQSGIYFIKLNFNNQSITKKLVIE